MSNSQLLPSSVNNSSPGFVHILDKLIEVVDQQKKESVDRAAHLRKYHPGLHSRLIQNSVDKHGREVVVRQLGEKVVANALGQAPSIGRRIGLTDKVMPNHQILDSLLQQVSDEESRAIARQHRNEQASKVVASQKRQRAEASDFIPAPGGRLHTLADAEKLCTVCGPTRPHTRGSELCLMKQVGKRQEFDGDTDGEEQKGTEGGEEAEGDKAESPKKEEGKRWRNDQKKIKQVGLPFSTWPPFWLSSVLEDRAVDVSRLVSLSPRRTKSPPSQLHTIPGMSTLTRESVRDIERKPSEGIAEDLRLVSFPFGARLSPLHSPPPFQTSPPNCPVDSPIELHTDSFQKHGGGLGGDFRGEAQHSSSPSSEVSLLAARIRELEDRVRSSTDAERKHKEEKELLREYFESQMLALRERMLDMESSVDRLTKENDRLRTLVPVLEDSPVPSHSPSPSPPSRGPRHAPTTREDSEGPRPDSRSRLSVQGEGDRGSIARATEKKRGSLKDGGRVTDRNRLSGKKGKEEERDGDVRIRHKPRNDVKYSSDDSHDEILANRNPKEITQMRNKESRNSQSIPLPLGPSPPAASPHPVHLSRSHPSDHDSSSSSLSNSPPPAPNRRSHKPSPSQKRGEGRAKHQPEIPFSSSSSSASPDNRRNSSKNRRKQVSPESWAETHSPS
uniref:Uncharacterized protein n=1 Tax=Chromera velia CCMP2878 TaxID=1169474 RepID=A0A0G4G2G5_9ALVE|eukprot:Cvel_19967.t1-p1 / transcript=Cvel_19967.t1 / gene=Cvel_19967 / organism=Chromera_velia_CCMP2878 / gene_product=hypothetical protein / transcript_product=hypothetical protein / location=Cvel_scaffold1758:8741-10756(+) / protein_length=672 / sequence_SO=supercontig / SO=protein_coding / is_pseudo=false